MKDIQNSPWPTIYIMAGIPGSGKSTWAAAERERRNAVIVSRDGIRAMLTGSDQKMAGDKDFEELVTRIETESVAEAVKAGRNVILDACNTRFKTTARNMDTVAYSVLYPSGPFPNIIPVVMDTPYDECLRRNAEREFPVPTFVLARMHESLEKELAK